jgi:predicted Zn finger-like uncharacterized protein
MRIICPTCASHYEVEADQIGALGQLVRCAQCREVWLVRAPQIDAAARHGVVVPVDSVADRAVARVVEPPREPIDFERARLRLRPRRDPVETGQSMGRTLAGLAAGLLSVAALMATLGFRSAIVDHLPAAAPVFAAVGLPTNPHGLALRDVRSALVTEGDKTVLTLEGHIANLRDGSTNVPALTVVVRDAAQTPLYTWTAPTPKTRLSKGETIEFHSRLAAPPQAGQDVRVSFADAGAGVDLASR